jgi:hypothetical protein
MPLHALNSFSKIVDKSQHKPPMYDVAILPDKRPRIAQQSRWRGRKLFPTSVSDKKLIPLIGSQMVCNLRLLRVKLPAEDGVAFENPDGI